jgi:hypothetical protein
MAPVSETVAAAVLARAAKVTRKFLSARALCRALKCLAEAAVTPASPTSVVHAMHCRKQPAPVLKPMLPAFFSIKKLCVHIMCYSF